MDTKEKQKLYSEILNLHDPDEAKRFDQIRQQANQELVDILQKLVNEQPSQRFSQILRNAGFISEDNTYNWTNEFYTEPQLVLARVKSYVENSKRRST